MKPRDMLLPALTRLEDAAACLSVPQDVLDVLRQPRETLQARLTIRMDDGSRRSFTAWRCRYDDSRGPTKGGLRYAPDASADEVETLAFWMTIKCAVMNLPYGGGKGAVRVDPDTLSRSELERLTRAYVRAFACVIGPDRDIPGPDIATNATIMAWMADEYSAIAGRRTLGVVTGKPVVLGGSLGREDATARGAYYLLHKLAGELGLAPGARVAVQGLGNVGLHIAQFMHEGGYPVVAVSDSRHGLARSQGLDVAAVIEAKGAGGIGALAGVNGVSAIDPDGISEIDCDIFIPAAVANVIHAGNAEAVKARVVLELANGPTAPEADDILSRRDVTVVPDILANAGGVTVSYFEWAQNRQGVSWPVAEVHSRLRRMMEEAGGAVLELSREKRVGLRRAAYVLALDRLATAIEAM